MNADTELPNGLRVRTVGRQTLGFVLPQLPGEEFRIAIPELISDRRQAILPWGFASPDFEIRKDLAQLQIEVPGRIGMEATIRFLEEKIEASVRVTNLSTDTWDDLNAFTCFACTKAPSFHNPDLRRTYIPMGGALKPIAELFAKKSPGSDPKTFFAVAGGPLLDDLWACRQLRQRYADPASTACACLASADGRWVAGIHTQQPAYLFNNRDLSCIHADPLLGTVLPGGSAEGFSAIHIFPGRIEDFVKRCRLVLLC